MKATFVFAIVAPVFTRAIRILQTNDDGWATSPTRLLFDRMNETHQVVLSAPADNRSGNGRRSLTFLVVAEVLTKRRQQEEAP